jgi:hypothetical protein
MRTRPQAVCDDEGPRLRYQGLRHWDMYPLACPAALLDNPMTAAKTVARRSTLLFRRRG